MCWSLLGVKGLKQATTVACGFNFVTRNNTQHI